MGVEAGQRGGERGRVGDICRQAVRPGSELAHQCIKPDAIARGEIHRRTRRCVLPRQRLTDTAAAPRNPDAGRR